MEALGDPLIHSFLAVGGRVVEHFFPQLGLPIHVFDLVVTGAGLIAGDP
jgi:hypothetical protein